MAQMHGDPAALGFILLEPWRGAGAVERGSLENCWRRKALVGSNPTPSACSPGDGMAEWSN
jgi:hypothetical protein